MLPRPKALPRDDVFNMKGNERCGALRHATIFASIAGAAPDRVAGAAIHAMKGILPKTAAPSIGGSRLGQALRQTLCIEHPRLVSGCLHSLCAGALEDPPQDRDSHASSKVRGPCLESRNWSPALKVGQDSSQWTSPYSITPASTELQLQVCLLRSSSPFATIPA